MIPKHTGADWYSSMPSVSGSEGEVVVPKIPKWTIMKAVESQPPLLKTKAEPVEKLLEKYAEDQAEWFESSNADIISDEAESLINSGANVVTWLTSRLSARSDPSEHGELVEVMAQVLYESANEKSPYLGSWEDASGSTKNWYREHVTKMLANPKLFIAKGDL